MWDFRQLKWLNYVGWWPRVCKTKAGYRISRVLGICLYLSNVIQIVPELISLYGEITQGSLKGTVLNLTSTLVGIMSAVKVGTIIIYEDSIEDFINRLQEMGQRAEIVLGNENKGKGREFYSRLSAIFVKVVMVGVGHWILRPIYLVFQGEKVLVIEAWVPGDLENWGVWTAVWVAQTLHVYSAMFGFFVFDSVCYSALASVLQQTDLLRAGLASIDFTQDSLSTLKFCVKHHCDILKVARQINDLLKYVLLAQYIMVTLVFCLSVFELSSVEGTNLVKTMNLLELIFNMTYVVFFYCFLSHLLEECNLEVMRSTYFNNWYMGSDSEKRILSVLQEASKKQLRFGVVVHYNLQAFIAILHTSFTYYNFLKAISGGDAIKG